MLLLRRKQQEELEGLQKRQENLSNYLRGVLRELSGSFSLEEDFASVSALILCNDCKRVLAIIGSPELEQEAARARDEASEQKHMREREERFTKRRGKSVEIDQSGAGDEREGSTSNPSSET